MLSGKRLVCQLLELSFLNHRIYSVYENNLWSSSHTEECRCNRNSQLHLDFLCFEFILVKHNFDLSEAVTESGEMARPDLNLELFRAQVLKSDEVPYFNAWGKTIQDLLEFNASLIESDCVWCCHLLLHSFDLVSSGINICTCQRKFSINMKNNQVPIVVKPGRTFGFYSEGSILVKIQFSITLEWKLHNIYIPQLRWLRSAMGYALRNEVSYAVLTYVVLSHLGNRLYVTFKLYPKCRSGHWFEVLEHST